MTEKADEAVARKLSEDPLLLLRALAQTPLSDDLREALEKAGHADIIDAAFPKPPPTVIKTRTQTREQLPGGKK